MKIRSHIRPWFYRVSIVVCLLSATASAFMIWKTTERNAYVSSFIRNALGAKKLVSRDDSVLALSRSVYALTNNKYGADPESMDWYDRFESTFFFNMSSTVALKYGSFGVHGHYVFGPCGTMSRLLLNTLWELNIPARKLQLLSNSKGKGGGHTLVEYFDEGKWKVVAVSDSSFVWRNAEGQIASVAEIQHDPAVFSQIYSYQANYPYLFDNPKHFNWTKVPQGIRNIVENIAGESFIDNFETPRIYDHPRLLLLYFCLGIFIVSTSLATHLRRTLTPQRQRTVLSVNAATHSARRCESVGHIQIPSPKVYLAKEAARQS